MKFDQKFNVDMQELVCTALPRNDVGKHAGEQKTTEASLDSTAQHISTPRFADPNESIAMFSMNDAKRIDTGSHSSKPVETSYLTAEERAEADSHSVFVGNVDYSVIANDLGLHFQGCGFIKRITIPCDKFSGCPKGFAYIEFAERNAVQNALALTRTLLHGRPIKVSEKRTNIPGITTTDRVPRGPVHFNRIDRGGHLVSVVMNNVFHNNTNINNEE